LIKGFAPGSWSQVAVDRTQPSGRVIGIDIIPAHPPKGVSTIQGNFLSIAVQEEVKLFLKDPAQWRIRQARTTVRDCIADEGIQGYRPSTRPLSHHESVDMLPGCSSVLAKGDIEATSHGDIGDVCMRPVDVVLSDMSAPWDQTTGFWKRSLSDPYFRMMNTSGMSFRDHAGSMDLCNSALHFAFDTLKSGGSLVCKFYQGTEDKALENKLRKLFAKVYREKPSSSRSASKEAYFVALKRKVDVTKKEIFG